MISEACDAPFPWEAPGANTPRAGVLHALVEHDADVLGISVTMLFNISMARQLVREAREQRPALSVIVGGAAFRAAPDFWRADDVRAAVFLTSGCRDKSFARAASADTSAFDRAGASRCSCGLRQ